MQLSWVQCTMMSYNAPLYTLCSNALQCTVLCIVGKRFLRFHFFPTMTLCYQMPCNACPLKLNAMSWCCISGSASSRHALQCRLAQTLGSTALNRGQSMHHSSSALFFDIIVEHCKYIFFLFADWKRIKYCGYWRYCGYREKVLSRILLPDASALGAASYYRSLTSSSPNQQLPSCTSLLHLSPFQ